MHSRWTSARCVCVGGEHQCPFSVHGALMPAGGAARRRCTTSQAPLPAPGFRPCPYLHPLLSTRGARPPISSSYPVRDAPAPPHPTPTPQEIIDEINALHKRYRDPPTSA
jgi:hypothetical protein